MDIHDSKMDTPDSKMDIHDSKMDTPDSKMDIHDPKMDIHDSNPVKWIYANPKMDIHDPKMDIHDSKWKYSILKMDIRDPKMDIHDLEQPKENKLVLEKPKENNLVLEKPRENNLVLEKPKENNLVLEQPKENKLAIIFSGLLQDVITGKINSIEDAICKIRINYEEKNVFTNIKEKNGFTNIKKKNIILLNFDDETMRPVLNIEDKYMEIIKKWYDNCNLLFDVEETGVLVPENITIQEVSCILFKDINYNHKEEYLNNYVPLIINNIISKRNIKDLEKKILVNTLLVSDKYTNEIKTSNNNLKIKELSISVPENINSSCVKDITNKKTLAMNYFMDREILYSEATFKIIEEGNLSNNNVSNGEPVAYNNEYDCLKPIFSENSQNVTKTKTENKTNSIYVLINDKFLQTITIKNPNQNELYTIKNHSEFGFINLFSFVTEYDDIINFIERELNTISFNDVEDVNKKLLYISQYIELSNKQNNSNRMVTTEENLVKNIINYKYTINGDINYKMKASSLYDIIINSNYVKFNIDQDKINGFRNRLSKYLKDLGLLKKRYNDGFYYYGIVEKQPFYHINDEFSFSRFIDIEPTSKLSNLKYNYLNEF